MVDSRKTAYADLWELSEKKPGWSIYLNLEKWKRKAFAVSDDDLVVLVVLMWLQPLSYGEVPVYN